MERIAPQMQRSFIYSGCYAALGGVSLAQRAAWGLYASSGTLDTSASTQRRLQPSTRTCNCTAAFTIKIKPAAVRLAPRTLVRARRRRVRCDSIDSDKGSRWQINMTPERARRLHGACTYRRVCVSVNGQHLTCTIFRGRAFVTATGFCGQHA
jgi:hypothetical protein